MRNGKWEMGFDGVREAADAAFQVAGYAVLTLGAVWLLLRFVP